MTMMENNNVFIKKNRNIEAEQKEGYLVMLCIERNEKFQFVYLIKKRT